MSVELKHAEKYAENLLTIYRFGKLPHHLQDRIVLNYRPATDDDFYMPPDLRNKSFIVTEHAFDKEGCEMISCFPYKTDLEPCGPTDSPHYIRIGNGFAMACQHACKNTLITVDSEFRDGQCYVANTYKKMLATAPEEFAGMKSKQNFHSGLDIVDGKLKLNNRYCRAFGTFLTDGDCTTNAGQYVAEILLGSTVIRSIQQAQHANNNDPLPQIPPVPDYLNALPRTKRAVAVAPPPPPPTVKNIPESSELEKLAKDLAAEIAVDYGVKVTTDFVSNVLRKRVPTLAVSAVVDLPIKNAMMRAVLASHAKAVGHVSKFLGSGVSVASGVFAIYGIAMIILDIIDPYEFNRVLTKKALEKIDRELDVKFFQTVNNFRVTVSPEILFEVEEDQSEDMTFYSTCIREYLTALHAVPEELRPKNLPPVSERFLRKTKMNEWPWLTTQMIGTGILLVLCVVISDYVQYWALLLFAFLVYINHKI